MPVSTRNRQNQSDREDEESNNALIKFSTPPAKGIRSQKNVNVRRLRHISETDNENESQSNEIKQRRSNRHSNVGTKDKGLKSTYAGNDESYDDGDYEDEDYVNKQKADDDDDYNPNEDEDEDEDDDEVSSQMSESSLSQMYYKKKKRKSTKVLALSSSEEEYEFDENALEDDNDEVLSQVPLSQLNHKHKRRKPINKLPPSSPSGEYEFDEDSLAASSSSSISDESLTIAQIREKAKENYKTPRRSPLNIFPACSSNVDAITQLPLTKVHVCWIAPNEQSRQCFNLDTLKKVALSTSIRGASGSRDYLQPPHFRTIISDELKDQIVAKFGRQALVISSTKQKEEEKDHWPSYSQGYHANLISADESPGYDFHDRLERYVRKQMGSADLYCCPLCYIETDRRRILKKRGELEHIDSDDDSEDEHEDEDRDRNKDNEMYSRNFFEFNADPMTILESFDDDFSTAATFCFRKVSDLKTHIRDIHELDCSVLDGNALFHKFRIRVADGLLQRYLKNTTQVHYWAEGYSFDFIFLLHIVSIHNEVGPSINPTVYEYAKSFPNRAKKVWEIISAPYLKEFEGELDDMNVSELDDDDEEEDKFGCTYGVQHRLAFTQEEDDEKEDPATIIVRELRARRGVYSDSAEDSNGCNESEITLIDNDSENSSCDQVYSESEDEDNDEWLKKKRFTPKKHLKKKSTMKKFHLKELGSSKNPSDNESTFSDVEAITALSQQKKPQKTVEATAQPNESKGSARRRQICESSDDDNDDETSFTHFRKKPASRKHNSKALDSSKNLNENKKVFSDVEIFTSSGKLERMGYSLIASAQSNKSREVGRRRTICESSDDYDDSDDSLEFVKKY